MSCKTRVGNGKSRLVSLWVLRINLKNPAFCAPVFIWILNVAVLEKFSMWQKFTERARRVILLAQEEASKMNSDYVGTEHLLLGLLLEDGGVASVVLQQMNVSLSRVRAQIEKEIETDVEEFVYNEPILTPKAKRVLELAADESRRMYHNYIGTEHLLLALLREKDGLAAKTLRSMGLNLDQTRGSVMQYLGNDPDATEKRVVTMARVESIDEIEKLTPPFEPPAVRDRITENYKRWHFERARLKDAQTWAIDNDDQELATLLKSAIERVTQQIAEHKNKTENSEGV